MQQIRRYTLLGLFVELLVLLLVSFIGWLWWPQISKSFLLGGLVFIVPNTYFAISAFRHVDVFDASQAVRFLMRGQAGKMALTVCAFALVFVMHDDVQHGIVFLSFLVMTVFHLFVVHRVIRYSLSQQNGTHSEQCQDSLKNQDPT